MPERGAMRINGRDVLPGMRTTVEIPIPELYTHTPMAMVAHVVRGRRTGPSLFVSAAMHGDELNGIEIVRRLLKHKSLARLRGSLIAVPVMNSYGVIQHSRYLPDRRDLNRAFPGSEGGSLAARLARLFMEEVVANASHGVDLHTGAVHRTNLPQLRADLDDPATLELARAFGVPVLLNAKTRDGSLRAEASARGIPTLLYEAGEALRFDEVSIRIGVRGLLNVMRALEMLPRRRRAGRPAIEPFIARSSRWIRAPRSGIVLNMTPLGTHVKKGGIMAVIADPYGEREEHLCAEFSGVVIGRTHLPLVNEGDAMLHIARFEDAREVVSQLDSLHSSELEDIERGDSPGVGS